MSQLSVMRSDYNENSKFQNTGLQVVKPFLNSAVVALSPTFSSPFVIADFGCSTGLNSSEAVSHVIRELRNMYGDSERCSSVMVVFNDLPANHWSELFGFVHGDQRSLMNEHRGVFAVASGKSFYDQVLPEHSLHFGISNFSVQFCSQVPVKISNNAFSILASDEERRIFAVQAARDWINFLTARSHELISGGILALSFLAASECIKDTFGEYYQAAKALCERGVIYSDELLDFNVRMHFRTLEEVTDKRQYESLGLELLTAEKVIQPPVAVYVEYLKHGDVNRFGEQVCGVLSAPLEPSFVEALSPARSEEDRRKVCEELRSELRARIVSHPEKFKFMIELIIVVIRKK